VAPAAEGLDAQLLSLTSLRPRPVVPPAPAGTTWAALNPLAPLRYLRHSQLLRCLALVTFFTSLQQARDDCEQTRLSSPAHGVFELQWCTENILVLILFGYTPGSRTYIISLGSFLCKEAARADLLQLTRAVICQVWLSRVPSVRICRA
jgi:hypothetical protein